MHSRPLIGRGGGAALIQDLLIDFELNVDLTYCVGMSTEAQDLISSMLQKRLAERCSAADVLQHEWLHTEGHNSDSCLNSRIQPTYTKCKIHAILLEALFLELSREHYEAARDKSPKSTGIRMV